MFEESLKNFYFYQNERYPKFVRFVQLWAQFTPWSWPKSGKIKIQDKNSAIGLSKSINPNPVALLPFKRKIRLLFGPFERFLVKKRAWSKIKGSESKSNLAYAGATIPGVLNMQRVRSHHMPVLSLSVLKVVFLNFKPLFQVWLLF